MFRRRRLLLFASLLLLLLPATRALARTVLQKEGILYRQSVFDKSELETLRACMTACSLQPEASHSIAQGRLGAVVSHDNNPLLQLLQDPTNSLTRLVQRQYHPDYILAPPENIPIEVRMYAQPGANMAWHVDDVLYDPPQLEVVWTLDNTSNCQTCWKDRSTSSTTCLESEPNAVLLLVAGQVEHCVTSLTYGKRTILKCAYVHKEAVRRSVEQRVPQFGGKKKRNRTKR